MTIDELSDKISNWESNNGESFTDYYMHDNVHDEDWGKFLVEKGFEERGNAIINVYKDHQDSDKFCCQDQEFLYHPNYWPKFYEDRGWKNILEYSCDHEEVRDDEAFEKDIKLWAEFLLSSKEYTDSINEWFSEN